MGVGERKTHGGDAPLPPPPVAQAKMASRPSGGDGAKSDATRSPFAPGMATATPIGADARARTDGHRSSPTRRHRPFGHKGVGEKKREDSRREFNDGRLLVRGLVKRPGKARQNRLSNGRLEFHQTTYQKPSAILITPRFRL